MARISCPECRRQISETAESCPKCGYKLTPEVVAAAKKKERNVQMGCAVALVVVSLPVFIWFINLSTKGPTDSYTRNSILIDIDNLVNQSASYVDSVVGTPEITPITKYPSMMPGEFRYYRLHGGSANIQFYKGQAKLFTIEFSSSTSSPLGAAARCGFEIGELGGLQKLPAGRKWTRVHTQNALYKHITVIKDSTGQYSIFQAEVF